MTLGGTRLKGRMKKMLRTKKWISCLMAALLVAGMLAILPTGVAKADYASQSGYINTTNTTVYQYADTGSCELGKLYYGDTVYVYGTSSGWIKLDCPTRGLEGYVVSGTVTYNATTNYDPTGYYGSGYTTGRVNIRKGPGTGYKSLGKLAAGTSVTINGMSGNWYYVTANDTGRAGYVHSNYISTGYYYGAYPTNRTVGGTGYINGTGVYLRSGPGTGYSVVATLAAGTTVTITSASGSWYYVTTGVYSGYVAMSSVTTNYYTGGSTGTYSYAGTGITGSDYTDLSVYGIAQ